MPYPTESDAALAPTIRASDQDGRYPRPQLLRERWHDLGGTWEFRYDDDDTGTTEAWQDGAEFDRAITVPFPPESTASGIGDRGFHPTLWYRRLLGQEDLAGAGRSGERPTVILHFGAVDYRADVWLDGAHLGFHEGGHTPFSFDITSVINRSDGPHSLVVRAEDDPTDVTQPRGKQDWLPQPHEVWYDRTSGIWQPVWLEAVPRASVTALSWTSDLARATVTLEVELRGATSGDLSVELLNGETRIARQSVAISRSTATIALQLEGQTNGQAYEQLLWSPEHPRLIDAVITFADGESTDVVFSYLGLREVAAERRSFLLNDRPYYVRSVLSQGFWPESHLAAPSADALRAEAQLIKELGFNAARVHQKIEDPRFLFWADKLGLLLWEEMPSALEFSARAIRRVVAEWSEAIVRDRSHPSIVTWVPINESWGVQHIAADPAIQNYARSLFALTKALDPSRPVSSNDGWEQVESDLSTVHDYEGAADVMRERYGSDAARAALFDGFGPAGRRVTLAAAEDPGLPLMLTEFGGIRYELAATADAWGYTSADSADEFGQRLRDLFLAVNASGFLAGDCYTQLTDTQQEANGLTDENRVPKLPIDEIARVIRR